jgi:hypothetical protein
MFIAKDDFEDEIHFGEENFQPLFCFDYFHKGIMMTPCASVESL